MGLELRSLARPAFARRTPAAALAAAAAAVVIVDEASKAIALHILPEFDAAPTRLLEFAVLHNVDLAWGIVAGADSATVSAVAALVVLGLSFAVCNALAAHDRASPVMLGLISGAGVANATDAITSPPGVADWVAVGAGGGIVFNLADVAALVGVALCARTAVCLALAVRRIQPGVAPTFRRPDPSRTPP